MRFELPTSGGKIIVIIPVKALRKDILKVMKFLKTAWILQDLTQRSKFNLKQ